MMKSKFLELKRPISSLIEDATLALQSKGFKPDTVLLVKSDLKTHCKETGIDYKFHCYQFHYTDLGVKVGIFGRYKTSVILEIGEYKPGTNEWVSNYKVFDLRTLEEIKK